MDTEKRELWDRLENESTRAFNAFEAYLVLPSGERTLTAAYQRHIGNPAAAPSDTWSRWSKEFAWRERAVAYDDHLAVVRREAHERGVEEQAEKQGREVEKARYRMNEMLTVGYERAMEWLDNAQPSDLRPQDVIQIAKLHLEAVKAFSVPEAPARVEDWTEEDDQDLVKRILPHLEAMSEGDEPDEDIDNIERSEGC